MKEFKFTGDKADFIGDFPDLPAQKDLVALLPCTFTLIEASQYGNTLRVPHPDREVERKQEFYITQYELKTFFTKL